MQPFINQKPEQLFWGGTIMMLRFLLCAALLSALAASPPLSRAVDLSGQSRTYLQARESAGSDRYLPFFEYLDFRAGGAGAVSFHFGGWLRYDLGDDTSPGKEKNSDLQYAYLSIRGSRADAVLNLGRVLVNEGVASEYLDGAHARAALRGGFDIAAFGGSPVETDFDDRSGDSVYGGRLGHEIENLYRVGFSYLNEQNDDGDFREEGGLDLWFRPFGKTEILGNSFYNSLTSDWMLHSYYLNLGPVAGFRLSGQGTYVSYRDYFTSATTTAFRFDPAVIDPAERLTTAGGEISYTFRAFTLSSDYKKYRYDIAGDARYFGGTAAYVSSLKGGIGASYHRMDGQTEKLQYDEYRAYAFTTIGKFNVAADYLIVRYAEEINGARNGTAAVLAAGYAVAAGAKIGADVEYGKNPYYDRDVRGLVKFVYNFDLASTSRGRK
jgi:hypothetical protein